MSMRTPTWRKVLLALDAGPQRILDLPGLIDETLQETLVWVSVCLDEQMIYIDEGGVRLSRKGREELLDSEEVWAG